MAHLQACKFFHQQHKWSMWGSGELWSGRLNNVSWTCTSKWHQMMPHSAQFVTKAAKSMHNIIRQLCGKLQPSPTATRTNWGFPKHSWMSDKPEKAATEKADWFAVGNNTHNYALLVYWCSIWMLVKSVFWHHVQTMHLLPDLFTIVHMYTVSTH